jgi:hypothetical protein
VILESFVALINIGQLSQLYLSFVMCKHYIEHVGFDMVWAGGVVGPSRGYQIVDGRTEIVCCVGWPLRLFLQ